MTYKAIHKFARISPTKVRPITEMIKNKSANEALTILEFNPRRGAHFLKKVVHSAMSNAEDLAGDKTYYVTSVRVDEGPTIKRFRARAMGRASVIRKRTSHILVEVSDEPKA